MQWNFQKWLFPVGHPGEKTGSRNSVASARVEGSYPLTDKHTEQNLLYWELKDHGQVQACYAWIPRPYFNALCGTHVAANTIQAGTMRRIMS
jgi:hypothetical protein